MGCAGGPARINHLGTSLSFFCGNHWARLPPLKRKNKIIIKKKKSRVCPLQVYRTGKGAELLQHLSGPTREESFWESKLTLSPPTRLRDPPEKKKRKKERKRKKPVSLFFSFFLVALNVPPAELGASDPGLKCRTS